MRKLRFSERQIALILTKAAAAWPAVGRERAMSGNLVSNLPDDNHGPR